MRTPLLLTRALLFIVVAYLLGGDSQFRSLAVADNLTAATQAERCRALLEKSVIKFYMPACVDKEFGGYHQELAEDGSFRGDEKFLTLQTRQLWFFSTLAVSNIHRQEALNAAKSGYDFIQKHFRDAKLGGYYSKVSRQGDVIDSRKHAYLNSFAIYAFVEYYRATKQPEVLEQAMGLFQSLESHAHDAKHLGYEEFFTSDWNVIADPKESGYVGAIGVKTYNTHLHLMEAFTSLYLETKNTLVGERLAELIEINTKTVKHPNFACNIDAWHPNWSIVETPQNLRASYGHDVECAWLVLDAAKAMGRDPHSLQDWAVSICEYSIKNGYDHKHGGFFYSGPLGKPSDDRKKEWWPQAEALVSMLTLYELTGDEKYKRLFDETFEFVEKHQVAPEGSWWATLKEDGSLGQNRTRTSMWQGAYHNGRSLLLCEQLLNKP